MKMMKLWRNILVMTAAMLSIASCSSDDDTDVYEAAELSGMWQKVYDEGIADAGIAQGRNGVRHLCALFHFFS